MMWVAGILVFWVTLAVFYALVRPIANLLVGLGIMLIAAGLFFFGHSYSEVFLEAGIPSDRHDLAFIGVAVVLGLGYGILTLPLLPYTSFWGKKGEQSKAQQREGNSELPSAPSKEESD